MPGLSIHVVDVTGGVPAQGMDIDVYELGPQRRKIAHGQLGPTGALDLLLARERLTPGTYEVIFHAGAFFSAAGVTQAAPPFFWGSSFPLQDCR